MCLWNSSKFVLLCQVSVAEQTTLTDFAFASYLFHSCICECVYVNVCMWMHFSVSPITVLVWFQCCSYSSCVLTDGWMNEVIICSHHTQSATNATHFQHKAKKDPNLCNEWRWCVMARCMSVCVCLQLSGQITSA